MANVFDAPFAQTSRVATGNTTFSTRGTSASGRSTTVNPFNQKFNATGDAPNKDYSKPPKSQQQSSSQQQAKPSQSLFDKFVTGAKSVTKSAIDTGKTDVQKAVNTGAALGSALIGTGTAGVQAAVGNRRGANVTLQATQQTANDFLDKGLGGKGGIISSKQANSSGGGTKGYVDNFVKPVTKGAAEYAPYAVPNIKGGSLLTKVGKSAGINATQSGLTDAANQVASTGKVGLRQTAKSAAYGGALGGVLPALDGVAGRLVDKNPAKVTTKDFIANTKAANLGHAARTTVDPGIVEQHPNASPEHVAAVNDFVHKAHTEDPVFQKTMQRVAGENKLDYHPGPAKDADRTFQKVMTDYNGNVDAVKDSIRGTVKIADHSPEAVQQTIDTIGKEMRIVNVKNLYDKTDTGYRDIKLTVETPSGHKGEIILATPEMLAAKHDLGGHDLYKIARGDGTEAEKLAAAQQMDELYGKAHADTMSRLASSGDLPNSSVSSLTASADDTLTASSGKTPTSLEAPVKTDTSLSSPEGNGRTASITPSDSKSVGLEGKSVIPSTIAEKTPKVNNKSISGKTVYRAGKEPLTAGKVTEHGISVTPNKGIAQKKFSAFWQKGNVSEHVLSKDAKIMPFKEIPEELYRKGQKPGELWPKGDGNLNYEKIVAHAKAQGYDGVNLKRFGEGEIRVFDAKHLTTAEKPKAEAKSIVDKVVTKPKEAPKPKEPTTLTAVQTAHMPDVGGYNHSSHMETEYADMLRGMEQQVKGGQMIPDGEGGYKRISEHSPFYRDFYAENKKPPTKADYLDEAKRQLVSGKAVHGGSEDYKTLLEREAKPIPRMEISKPSVPAEQGIAKVAKRIATDIKGKYGDLATYDKLTIKDQAEKAAKLITDREALNKVISGEAPLPDGLRATSIITAIRHDPELLKDGDLLKRIANSPLASEASHSAQELRLARENARDDPIEHIRSLQATRTKALEKKTGKTEAKLQNDEIKLIRQAKPKVTKETFNSFVNSLRC